MCNYSEYVWEKGIERGREEGREEGETRLATLLLRLNAAGETEQFLAVLNDVQVRKELYNHYNL